MKKLLVAAMGIATAYGAFADPFSVGKRFQDLTVDDTVTTNELNEAAGGTFWTDPVGATNTYTVKTMDAYDGSRPAFFPEAPTKSLEVKTTFGSPLKFNFKEGDTQTIGEEGLYFDSLVKFTVCDSAPEDKAAYDNAKIMMWLQSDDDNAPTNIMIRAGYLTYSAGTVGSVETNYTCYTVGGDFAESWHRVTIKAIKDITSSEPAVPGFVVFIDGDIVNVAGDYDVWGDGFPARTAKASHWESYKALFPSMVQTGIGIKDTLSAVEFDGTGWLNDVTVTEIAPSFAVEPAAPEVAVTINGAPHLGVLTFADAVTAVNGGTYGAAGTATITLSKDAVITEPVEFTANATITLDFAGFVLTNTVADAAITNSAAALIITNSSETVGGIWCNDAVNNFAFYAAAGETTIEDGFFRGNVAAASSSNLDIVQGYFTQITGQLEAYLPEGKELAAAEEMPGFNKVVDKPIETHTITFDANGGTLTGDSTQVIDDGDPVEKPSDPTRTDYTFVGWFWNDDDNPETPMVKFDFSDAQDPVLPDDDLTLYAQWEADEPAEPEIDPSDPEPVEVEAEDGDKAIEAVVVPAPAGADIDTPAEQAAYKDLFNYTATEKSTGVYEVTLTGIKEEKVAEVNEDAVESLVAAAAQSEATTVSVDVPAGLYYKVTTYDALGGTPVDFETGLSTGTGTLPVDKPTSATQGFIKVEMATVPFNN